MYDTIIIGGGISGATAAIYAARRKMKSIILTLDLGGQLNKITEIENWPGEDKISGLDFAGRLAKQLQKFDVQIKYGQAAKIIPHKNGFIVQTMQAKYQCKTVILAFGKVPRTMNIKGEDQFMGRGVSYCATCDAPFFKDKTVAVMGGGNSALDAAILLSKIASKVYLIHRRDQFRAEKHLVDKLASLNNIETVLNSNIAEIKGSQKVEKLLLENSKELTVNGLFIEAGFVVNNVLVKDLVEFNQTGSIIVDDHQQTSHPGIFAAGDMTTSPYQQLVIAAGQGATAALAAYEYTQRIK